MGRENEATRDRYGEVLVALAREHGDVVVMDCDLGRSTRSFRITEVDKKRFFEMGIAEQDMVSTAAGMAREGKVVFVNSFAVFVTGRAFDQIRQQVSLARTNVKVCGSSAGLTQGADGATHQSVVDVSLMRSLPNMVVMVPADGGQAEAVVRAAYGHEGPVYIRLSRYGTGPILPEGVKFEVGKVQELEQGDRVVIVGSGPVLKEAYGAVLKLREEGIRVGLVNVHTIKPIDEEGIGRLGERYEVMVSVEEHSVIGGLGSAIAEVVSERGSGVKLVRLGVRDTYGESGTAEELLAKHGLDADGIVKSVKHIVNG
jgi:transketolase